MAHDERLNLTIADVRKSTDDGRRAVYRLEYHGRRCYDDARGFNHDSIYHAKDKQ